MTGGSAIPYEAAGTVSEYQTVQLLPHQSTREDGTDEIKGSQLERAGGTVMKVRRSRHRHGPRKKVGTAALLEPAKSEDLKTRDSNALCSMSCVNSSLVAPVTTSRSSRVKDNTSEQRGGMEP